MAIDPLISHQPSADHRPRCYRVIADADHGHIGLAWTSDE
jgi:hypothetical protein